jgi:hypothetical protein
VLAFVIASLLDFDWILLSVMLARGWPRRFCISTASTRGAW